MSQKKSVFVRYRGTLVMALLAVALGGFAWVEYQRAQYEREAENKAKMIVGWEEIKDYQSAILQRGSETVEVVRSEGGWKIISPVEDKGDAFNIESWLTDMGTEKGRRIDAKKGPDGKILWAEYGLDKNLVTLTMTKKDGTTEILRFAEHSAFDGSYFLKYNDQVWIGDKPWVSVLNKKLKHLRLRDVYRHEKGPVGFSFDYMNKGRRNFSVFLNGDQWQFENGNEMVLEQDVLDWIQALRKVSVVEYIDHLSGKDLKKFGQHRPLFKLRLQMSESEQELWTVSKVKKKDDRERYYIRIGESSTLFEADKAFVERFSASLDYFKNGRPPFELEIEKIQSIQVTDRGHQAVTVVKDESGQWSLAAEVKGFEFDSVTFESYLTQLEKLQAQLFLKKSQLKGTNKPRLQVTVKAKDKEKVFLFGESFSSDKTFARLNPLVYTEVVGTGAFAVHKAEVDALGIGGLLKQKELEKSSNESSQN